MPISAANISRAVSLSAGTTYVIVFGLNAKCFLPSMLTVFKSLLVNNKSPCSTPLIPKSLRCSNDEESLSRKPCLLTASPLFVVSG